MKKEIKILLIYRGMAAEYILEYYGASFSEPDTSLENI